MVITLDTIAHGIFLHVTSVIQKHEKYKLLHFFNNITISACDFSVGAIVALSLICYNFTMVIGISPTTSINNTFRYKTN